MKTKKVFLWIVAGIIACIGGLLAVHAVTNAPVSPSDPNLEMLRRIGASDAVYCGEYEDPVTPANRYKLYQSQATGFEYRFSTEEDGYLKEVRRTDQSSIESPRDTPVAEEVIRQNALDFFNLCASDYQIGTYQISDFHDHVAMVSCDFVELVDGMETGTVGTVFCAPNGEVTSAVFVKGEILPTAGDAAPLSAQSFPETVSPEAAAQTALEAARQDAGERHATVVSVPDTVEGQLKASGANRLWMFDFPVEVQDEGGPARPVGYRIWIDASTGELYQLYRSMND